VQKTRVTVGLNELHVKTCSVVGFCDADSGVARQQGLGTNQGIWGTEVPQRGPGAEPRWGSGAKPPEAEEKSVT